MIFYRWTRMTIIVVVVAVIATTLFNPAQRTTAAVDAQDFSASIQPLSGLVQQLPAGQDQWQTVTQTGLLHQGDRVRTADNGLAQISTVTGITMKLWPDSIVELKQLSLGTGNDTSLNFGVTQTAGISYFSVDQALKKGDNVQVFTPNSSVTIHGTKFYTFTAKNGTTYVLGDESTVNLSNLGGQTEKTPPDSLGLFAYTGTPKSATDLQTGSKGQSVSGLDTDAKIKAFRQFLSDVYDTLPDVSANPKLKDFTKQAFFATLLGLPNPPLPTDQQIADGIAKLDIAAFLKKETFTQFSQALKSFLQGFANALQEFVPIAPSTCGTDKPGPDENPQNCPQDFVQITATCGNGVCESALGEDIVTCPADCNPNGDILQQGADDNANGNGGNGGNGNGGNGGNGTNQSTPIPTAPPASGAGI